MQFNKHLKGAANYYFHISPLPLKTIDLRRVPFPLSLPLSFPLLVVVSSRNLDRVRRWKRHAAWARGGEFRVALQEHTQFRHRQRLRLRRWRRGRRRRLSGQILQMLGGPPHLDVVLGDLPQFPGAVEESVPPWGKEAEFHGAAAGSGGPISDNDAVVTGLRFGGGRRKRPLPPMHDLYVIPKFTSRSEARWLGIGKSGKW